MERIMDIKLILLIAGIIATVGFVALVIYLRIFATDEIRKRVGNTIRGTFGVGYGISHGLFNKENGHVVRFFRWLFSKEGFGVIFNMKNARLLGKVLHWLLLTWRGWATMVSLMIIWVTLVRPWVQETFPADPQYAITAEQREMAPMVGGNLYNPADYGGRAWAIPEFYIMDDTMTNWRGTVTQTTNGGAIFRYAHWSNEANAFVDATNGVEYRNGGEYYKSDGTPVTFQTDSVGWQFVVKQ